MKRARVGAGRRSLDVGDPVEVFIEPSRRWCRGTFGVSRAGTAFVEIDGRVQFRLEQALLMGLRRLSERDAKRYGYAERSASNRPGASPPRS